MNWYKTALDATQGDLFEETREEPTPDPVVEIKEDSVKEKLNIQEKEKKPYYPVVIVDDRDTRPENIKDIAVNALSSEQARAILLRTNMKLRGYIESGFEVEARLDHDELYRRQKVNEYGKKKEEETINNAWWQD